MKTNVAYVIGVVFFICLSVVNGAAIVDDYFDGAYGTDPNSSDWSYSTGVIIDGNSNLLLDTSGGQKSISGNSYQLFAPSSSAYGLATFHALHGNILWNMTMGLVGSGGTPRILLRTDIGDNMWNIDVNGEGYFQTDVARSDGIGTWTIEWATSRVRVWHNGILKYNSQVDQPSITIPTSAMKPDLAGSGGQVMKVSRICWESVADGSSVIQAMINDATENDTVYLIGNYSVGSQIVINKPLTLEIDGTLSVKNNPPTAADALIKINSSNVKIKGGKLDGDGFNWSAIATDNSTALLENVVVENVHIEDFASENDSPSYTAIGFCSVSNGRIANNKIENCGGYGIYLQYNNKTLVVNNDLDKIWYTGINVSAGVDNTVESNKVRRIKYFGMKAGYGLSTTVTSDISPTTTSFSIVKNATTAKTWFVGCDFTIIMGISSNLFGKVKSITDEGTYYVIYVAKAMETSPSAGQGIELLDTRTNWINNIVEYTGDNGFDINVTASPLIQGNQISYAGEYTEMGDNLMLGSGIWLGADPQGGYNGFKLYGITVCDNKIKHTAGSAIAIMGAPFDVAVTNNECIAYNELKDPNSSNPDYGGIEVNRLTYHPSTKISITNNHCISDYGYGILLGYATFSDISNNMIKSACGIKIACAITSNNCRNNTIEQSIASGYGVRLDDSGTTNHCHDVFFIGNTTIANGENAYALDIVDTAANYITVCNDNIWTVSGSASKLRCNSTGIKLFQEADDIVVPGESVYSEKSGEVRESQFSGTIGVGVTKQIAEFYANSGTIGMLTIEGVGRTGTSYKQAFRVLVTGNTASNAKTLTSLGNVGNSFLASGDFTVSASGNQVKLSYKNNESADVHMNVRVEFVSGY